MISLLPPQALPGRFIRISAVLRRYASQLGMEAELFGMLSADNNKV
jgi:hypothetical protein